MSGSTGNQLVLSVFRRLRLWKLWGPWENKSNSVSFGTWLRACLHGVGDPRLVGWFLLFSRFGGHKTKETYPTKPGSPTPCKQGLKVYHVDRGLVPIIIVDLALSWPLKS